MWLYSSGWDVDYGGYEVDWGVMILHDEKNGANKCQFNSTWSVPAEKQKNPDDHTES